ncbi:hypothetical protein A2U01_0109315, partial [Trifolium medium]|nr:hypothetical protein [Trifolium medium]
VLQQTIKYRVQMHKMFLQGLAVDQDVVKEDDNEMSKVLLKQVIHGVLKG